VTRILVTGSQGFVGKHLRSALAARQCTVLGLDRPGTHAELAQDLSDPEFDAAELARRVGPIDGIIYLAATITRGSSVSAAARANLRAIADAPIRLLEAWHTQHSPTHFVYCSTYKVYGPAEELAIDPRRPPQRPDPHSYGSAKLLAERLLEIAARRLQVRYAIVRPTCIYGPGQHLHNAIPVFLSACLEGKRPTVFGSGGDLRDDVLASDLAYCLAEASLRRAEGPFHAAGDGSRDILSVAELCCDAVAKLSGSPRLCPLIDARQPPKWWLDQSFDIGRTRSELGYAPTPLLTGLECEARWLMAGARPEDSIAFSPLAGPARSPQ
jgi:UDP-glucose 4-epimerase